MRANNYIAFVAVCGLLLGCQKQQVQTADEASQPSEPAKKVENKPFIVKGFYIGMPQESANALLNSYKLDGISPLPPMPLMLGELLNVISL